MTKKLKHDNTQESKYDRLSDHDRLAAVKVEITENNERKDVKMFGGLRDFITLVSYLFFIILISIGRSLIDFDQ